jgi:hypothetical protein
MGDLILYHYTCEHGRESIGRRGFVLPMADHAPRAAALLHERYRGMATLAWFTDLDAPVADALGLTGRTIQCDRTAYRYRVTDTAGIIAWLRTPARGTFWGRQLEREPGSLPRHWYVTRTPVPVVLA